MPMPAGMNLIDLDDLASKDRMRVLVHGREGHGKAQPLDEPVLTPSGWLPIGKLNRGDQVIGVDGEPHPVYGIWDRGVQPVYQVTMNDGSSTRVGPDHLWRVTNHRGRDYVVPTTTLMEQWGVENRAPSIPRMKPVQHPERDLTLPPYLLGALLADGYLNGSSLQWTKNDPDVMSEVRRSGASGGFELREVTTDTSTARQWRMDHVDDRHGYSTILQRLEVLGLRGALSRDKFIPAEYLVACEWQRRALLEGLMDGDGTVTRKGCPQYHTVSLNLARDVEALCWSLGIFPDRRETRKPDGTYRVSLRDCANPFRVSPRGHECRRSTWGTTRRIVSIDYLSEQPTRCIAVAAPENLYVTRNYIVTHNSTRAATIAQLGPTLFIDTLGEKGIRSLEGADFGHPIKVWRIQNILQLDDCLWWLMSGDHPFACVVIDSVTGWQQMVKRYLKGYDQTSIRNVDAGEEMMTQGMWGDLGDHTRELAQFWYSLADGERDRPMHVVMTAQSKVQEIPGGGTEIGIDMQGGGGAQVARSADYILFCDKVDASMDPEHPEAQYLLRWYKPGVLTKGRVPKRLRDRLKEAGKAFPHTFGPNTGLGRIAKLLGVTGTENLRAADLEI